MVGPLERGVFQPGGDEPPADRRDPLELDHDIAEPPLPPQPDLTKAEARREHLQWAREHAAPWVQRRVTGRSSGDAVSAKRPTLGPVE